MPGATGYRDVRMHLNMVTDRMMDLQTDRKTLLKRAGRALEVPGSASEGGPGTKKGKRDGTHKKTTTTTKTTTLPHLFDGGSSNGE